MMKSIVEEKLVSFKTLEQKVFAYVCELGRLITADCHPKRPPVPCYPASVSHIIRPAINHYSTVLLT